MRFRRAAAASLACAIALVVAGGSVASEAPQSLPFTQDWSDTSLITTNNDWSGVPGIVGYRGDGMTSTTGVDPQTVLADGSGTPVNVIANQTNPNTLTTGGVAEFEIAKPTVALQGSGTARAPHLVINVDTTGKSEVAVAYNLRDIDGSADNAVQPVALHYRVGSTGNYTNVPAAFVADATEGPNLAGKVTPVSVTLPAAVDDQPLVQLRIMTTDAVGSDEWVGIDDISVTAGGVAEPPVPSGAPVVISEFRVRGPNGGNDEFVELYNRSAAPVDIGGWQIRGSNAAGTVSTRATIPSGTILAPNCYYLATNSNLTAGPYSGAVPGDITFTVGITDDGGIGLTLPDNTVVDAVGMSVGSAFKEGTPLASLGTANLDRGYERKPGGAAGNGQDTDDNSADFHLLAPSNPQNSLSTCLPADVDLPPFVASTTPANNAVDVPVDSTITIEFSEAVTVAASWFSISCSSSGAHSAQESGGPQTYVLTPDDPFAQNEACTVTVAGDKVSDSAGQTMAADHVFDFQTAAPPTTINEIQGRSHISPLVGQHVSGVHGIVTATRSNGFYFQDPDPDGDPATSDGLFVFTGGAPTVAAGHEVRVGGMVSEFRPGGIATANLTITQLTGPSITTVSIGNPLPAPTVIGQGGRMPPTELIHPGCASGTVEDCDDVPFDPDSYGIDFYESLEGMLVEVEPNAVVVGPTNNFGETVLLPDNGVWAGIRTNRFGILVRDLTPSSPGDYSQGDFNPERIMIDDEIVRPLPRVHVGDRLATAAVGVMDYSFGNFKIQVTSAPEFGAGGLEREVTRLPRAQELAVATFNVENLWPNPARGTEQFDQLADLIVNNLRSPDLIGIEEVQDNDGPTGGTSSPVTDASVTWNMLVAAIEAAGGPTYEWRDIAPEAHQDGGQPGGNIRVGFLFRTDRGLEFVDRPGGDATTPTQPVGHPSGVQLTFSPGRVDPQNEAWVSSRKPLAGEFKFRGKKLIAIVNHFNSKGGDNPLFGRFQPPVRGTEVQRHQQAAVVNQFVLDVLAIDPDALVVVNGDINDFDFSETVQILESDGAMQTLMRTLPLEERYSYVFEGNAQVLDQTLASPALMARLVDYDVVHVNSEFHDQASDHEPQVARFWMIESDRPRR